MRLHHDTDHQPNETAVDTDIADQADEADQFFQLVGEHAALFDQPARTAAPSTSTPRAAWPHPAKRESSGC